MAQAGGPHALGVHIRVLVLSLTHHSDSLVRRLLWNFCKTFPIEITVFTGVILWEWYALQQRQEEAAFHKHVRYEYLEAKELGLAREIPYVDPSKIPTRPRTAPKKQESDTNDAAAERLFDLESYPSSSAAPLSQSAEQASSGASPSSSPLPYPPTFPPPNFDHPLSLAEAVPLMLTPEQKKAQKKEAKRQQKEEMLEALREADMKRPETMRTYKSPKEIYAHELATFAPSRYRQWIASEKRKANARKLEKMRLTPLRQSRHNPHAEKKRETEAKLQNSVAAVNSLLRKSHEFHRDVQLAVMAENQAKQEAANERIRASQAAMGADVETKPQRSGPKMPMKDKDRVAEAARARFTAPADGR